VPVRRAVVSLARRFHQVCLAVAAEALQGEDLVPLEFGALIFLRAEPDIDQSGLAARLGIDRTSASALVSQLEGKALIERRVNADDRRARLLRVSPAGEALFERLEPATLTVGPRILAPLEPAERETLLDLLTRVIDGNEGYVRPGAARRKPSASGTVRRKGG